MHKLEISLFFLKNFVKLNMKALYICIYGVYKYCHIFFLLKSKLKSSETRARNYQRRVLHIIVNVSEIAALSSKYNRNEIITERIAQNTLHS